MDFIDSRVRVNFAVKFVGDEACERERRRVGGGRVKKRKKVAPCHCHLTSVARS